MAAVGVPSRPQRSTGTKTITVLGSPVMQVSYGPAYDGEAKSRVSGRLTCEQHNEPVAQAWQCPGVNKPHLINRADLIKTFEAEDGALVTLTASEEKALEAETDEAIELLSWVEDIDPGYYDGTAQALWWPDVKSRTWFRMYSVWMNVLRDKGGVLIGTTADHGKFKVVSIRYSPEFGCLAYQAMKFVDQMRRDTTLRIVSEGAAVYEPSSAELEMANTFFDRLSGEYDITSEADTASQRKMDAINEKAATGAVTTNGQAVVDVETDADILDLLKRSVGNIEAPKPKRKPAKVKA